MEDTIKRLADAFRECMRKYADLMDEPVTVPPESELLDHARNVLTGESVDMGARKRAMGMQDEIYVTGDSRGKLVYPPLESCPIDGPYYTDACCVEAYVAGDCNIEKCMFDILMWTAYDWFEERGDALLM